MDSDELIGVGEPIDASDEFRIRFLALDLVAVVLDALPRLSHAGLSIPPNVGADFQPAARRESRIELPIWAEGLEVGRFVLTLGDDATGLEFAPEARTSALALADRLGVALRAHDR